MAVDNPPLRSPLEWRFEDYLGRAISLRVTFNNNTRRITGATVTRDAGCLYSTLYWDVGEDGTPNTSARKATVPVGTVTLGAGALRTAGLTNVEDVDSANFTAGP